jgi:RHH-type proline utilization regulon transcriptional repressor/proline dehydrogenase/delta 1-pyrroline-5-carboxylate dehydrogenase
MVALEAAHAAGVDWDRLDAFKYADEATHVRELLNDPPLTREERAAVTQQAQDVVRRARALRRRKGVMESFLEEFGLANQEGLALMCLAESLLRVPDQDTVDKLIAEKLLAGNWSEHFGKSDSLLVNASTWGLMLTGRLIDPAPDVRQDAPGVVRKIAAKAGEPMVRAAIKAAMRMMGEQFVLGDAIEEALRRARQIAKPHVADVFSFDMLGEGARTLADAERHFEAYRQAIAGVGAEARAKGPVLGSGVSVKLSALHPRYDVRKQSRVMNELYPRLYALARLAASYDIGFCLDAEEADRLILSLKLLERLADEPELQGWTGLGVAVQAYQKRALGVIDGLRETARRTGRRFQVRLVKGAYWDSEIKRAQVAGRPDYAVYTTKAATDLSYLACARALLRAPDAFYPQFATHNAVTVAAVRALASLAGDPAYEFQRLHGMGEALYLAQPDDAAVVRVYAPVGAHQELLPYLIRRLLENGANTSFVHAFLDADNPVEAVARDPFETLEAGVLRHPRIAPPALLFAAARRNSSGIDLTEIGEARGLQAAVDGYRPIAGGPIVNGRARTKDGRLVECPADAALTSGSVALSCAHDIEAAAEAALAAQPVWCARGGAQRAAILRAMADALERDMPRLIALMAYEAGKTLQDGIDEVREAVDFCRYYAVEAERLFVAPVTLPGPAGETNQLALAGRGVFVCISPWNFPLAIFTGQVAAALAAGNTVLAKPAEQTPLAAFEAVRLFQDAGLPGDVLHLLPGDADTGAALVRHPDIAGVAFTGSIETARAIARALAAKDGPITPLIAETGGLNAMFVDTTALREQVCDDVITSAFSSAGQRCSALRLLFLPFDTADSILESLAGAVSELKVGDPARLDTDVGPIIDPEARAALERHLSVVAGLGRVVARAPVVPALAARGLYFAPTIVEITSADLLDREVFGPILHVVRYDPEKVAQTAAALARKGYGLTLGVHSRLESFQQLVRRTVPVGNVYVNRSMIGAVVGVQPFGGERLSGTGPKAGGPNYLARFATERTLTVNIAAQGGDPHLLNL